MSNLLYQVTVECPQCGGEGELVDSRISADYYQMCDCGYCGGSGKVSFSVTAKDIVVLPNGSLGLAKHCLRYREGVAMLAWLRGINSWRDDVDEGTSTITPPVPPTALKGLVEAARQAYASPLLWGEVLSDGRLVLPMLIKPPSTPWHGMPELHELPDSMLVDDEDFEPDSWLDIASQAYFI